jgi:hypothetical protein
MKIQQFTVALTLTNAALLFSLGDPHRTAIKAHLPQAKFKFHHGHDENAYE